MNFASALKASLQEAIEIEKGSRKASRITRIEVEDIKADTGTIESLTGGICTGSGHQR